jgi:hypothetical protein
MTDYKIFKLEIEIGNDAMQTPEDIARALRIVALNLEIKGAYNGLIIDGNGNCSGRFEFIPEGC